MRVHEITSYGACAATLKAPGLRQSLYDAASVMMEKALVNLDGAEHRARRTVESKVFRKDFFLLYEREVLPKTMAQTIAPYLAAGSADLVDLGYRIMMNLTIDFAGIDRPEQSTAETADLLRLLKVFSLAPSLGQRQSQAGVSGVEELIRAAMDEFDQRYLAPSVTRRRALIASVEDGADDEGVLPRDVLTSLLASEDKLALTPTALLQEAIFLTLAGAHTSIHSLTHAVHEILVWAAANPATAHRLMDDPFFVQRCVYESLRLHPSSPVAKRKSSCPMTLAAVGDIAAEDELIVNLRAANRDPSMFGTEADVFDPDRQVPSGQFGYGLSMGLGMHACLGRNLAVGVPARPETDPATHHYGTVPLIVSALLRHGLSPDLENPPLKDVSITRISWASYPVLLGEGRA